MQKASERAKPNTDTKPEHAWHRHPLLVSAFSLLIGGVGIGLLQNRIAEKKALREKRYAVADNLVRYMGQAGTTLRLFDLALDDAQKKSEYPMKSERFFPVQQSLNSTLELQNRLEVDLAIFFSTDKPLSAFLEFRNAVARAINSAEIARKSGKYGTHSFNDYTAELSRKADNCICALKGDLPLRDIGAGRCHEEMRNK